MKTKNLTLLFFLTFLMATSCKSSGEFDPGPFAGGDKGDKTLLTFQVSDASGDPIEGAYVVSYRQLAPLHIRVGEGFTDQQGQIQLEDQTHTTEGYATVVAPGYNSKKVTLNIEQKQENTIQVTLADQDVLKVMSYNILVGLSNDTKLRQDFAAWVATYDPDIILFQETSNFTDASFAAFAKTFGHDYAVRTKTTGIPTGITSKEPITNIRKVVQTGVLHHGYVTGETSGMRIFSIHLCPYELDNERNIYQIDRKDEIEIIMNDATQYTNVPVIMGGDLNSHNTFDRDSYGPGYSYGNRDHAVYNTVKENNFYDTYPLRNSDFKATWPVAEIAVNGPNRGARLDYMFVNNTIKNDVVFSDILYSVYTDKFSDHYPTYIEIKK
ncbi:endonuclease/exonuclease/phosphatase family protein [Sphingobacterium sp. SGG-5]|uniref:endonuclease/exonuclease/phosphatase family protein n=1 Tax=Sphingobacterium sp. SGG-5 TaxID=2710881 RepID=UPI0013EADB89|nr:endonuclease/exonuclease/phosphatase family protein [Sphingobacterium sp. SGG-5]NGM60434.1 endonuclease/exonuclease/phosphatase family protein [Sphingobacterium sp. SGG-5]